MVWLRSFFLVQKIIALGISGKDIRINYQNKKSSFHWLRLAIRTADIRKLWNLYKKDPEAKTNDGENWYEYGLSFDYVAPGITKKAE